MGQTLRLDGFTQHDFDTFNVVGLEGRMTAIEKRLRPKLKAFGEILTERLSESLDADMFLHVAKHARRTVNPPHDTWLAISANKRGYKQHPHFQLGLFDDRVFIWLAFIYEVPAKATIAQRFLNNPDALEYLIPGDFVVSADHTKKNCRPLHAVDLQAILQRFRDVKKAEFLIGRQITATEPILTDGAALIETVEKTYNSLIPLYQLAQG